MYEQGVNKKKEKADIIQCICGIDVEKYTI